MKRHASASPVLPALLRALCLFALTSALVGITGVEAASVASNTVLPAFNDNSYHATLAITAQPSPTDGETSPGRKIAELHFTLPATSSASVWIHIENPRFNHVRLQRDDGKLWLAGTDYPLTWWQTLGGEILFTETVTAQTAHAYTLHIEHDAPINSSMEILSEQEMLRHMGITRISTGVLTGFIAGLIIYAVFLAFSHREYTYLYLAVATSTIALMQLNELGTLYPLWPQSPYWGKICSDILPMISTWAGVQLLRKYLLTQQHIPRLDTLLQRWVWYVPLVCIPVAFFNNHDLILVTFAVPALLSMLVSLTAIIARFRQGYQPARLYLVANILPIGFGTLLFLSFLGIIPHSPLTALLPLFGTASQLVLFALALGNRMNWLNEQQLRAQRQTLRSRSETIAKKNFLAQVSHELRTPLIGIIGLSELLDNKPMLTADRLLLTGLQHSARHLLQMTNDLLEYARLEAGKASADISVFDLHELATRLISSHRDAAQAKQLMMTLQIADHVPRMVAGDPQILKQILSPVIDNAIKFTHHGGIFLMISRMAPPALPTRKDDRLWLRIDVLDTGVGFDQLFEQRAFGLFELADHSSTRPTQGTGLGLSLSRQYCQLLGGTIDCESEREKGTLFWITLPFGHVEAGSTGTATDTLADATANTGNPAPATGEPAAAMLPTVLVAEDDRALQMIIRAQLEQLGYHCLTFSHGRQLADWYAQQDDMRCVMLVDWQMPVCNGADTIKRVRHTEQQQRRPPAPIAVLTAYDSHAGIAGQLPAGVAILHKPLDLQQLAAFLNDSVPVPPQ